jgi:hypothetical protein
MGIFRREPSLLDDPSVIELREIYFQMVAAIKILEGSQSLDNAKAVFNLGEKFAFQYVNNCPKNFMLRLNHESLAKYKEVQSWIYEAESARTWSLGAYVLLKIEGGKSISREKAEILFNDLISNMTPISGKQPSFNNAMAFHGQ